MLASLLRILLGIALGVPLLAWLFQERLLFFPRSLQPGLTARPDVEKVTVVAADSVNLRGWFVKGASSRAPLVVYFGGNAEEVSWLVGVADQFAGWSLLLVNYRGYGESEGRPSEKALFEDALLVHDYARRRPDVDPERVVAMGRSLGSGVAVYLAANRPLRGVVLVSPYDSMVEVAKRHYPYLRMSTCRSFASRQRKTGLSPPCIRARFLTHGGAPKPGVKLTVLATTASRASPTTGAQSRSSCARCAERTPSMPLLYSFFEE